MAAPCPLLARRRHHGRRAAPDRPVPPHCQGPALPPARLPALRRQGHRRAHRQRRWGSAGPPAAPEMLCIAEEAGRLWGPGRSEQERGWVLRGELESWLGLMRRFVIEVRMLRLPLVFGRRHPDFALSQDGNVATKRGDSFDWTFRTAASKVVMRSGQCVDAVTASTTRSTGAGSATPTGRGRRPRRSKVTASVCCSTLIRAA